MKTTFKIGQIELGEVKVGGIEVSTDYSLNEVRGVYSLVREVLADLPEIIGSLEKGAVAYEEADERMDRLHEARRQREQKMGCIHSKEERCKKARPAERPAPNRAKDVEEDIPAFFKDFVSMAKEAGHNVEVTARRFERR